ncbi:hypothetical protein [Solidesulfovibrio sp. C21]|uniref:hypothetical protein n=1 Tax=Solidesulfovibrio sp. C21 TaxID=3398613 RepID=UPI0039FB9353
MKVTMNGRKSNADVGTTVSHFGHTFVVQEDKTLVAEIDEKMAEIEVASGRLSKVEGAEPTSKVLTDMKLDELRAYAKERGITIGADNTTKDAILAVIQAAEAKA